MAINENDLARVKHILSLANKVKGELDLTIRHIAADKSLTSNGYSVAVNISEDEGNILSLVDDGLFVPNNDAKVTGAVQGNFAIFGQSGAIVDSGVTFVSDEDFNSALSGIFS